MSKAPRDAKNVLLSSFSSPRVCAAITFEIWPICLPSGPPKYELVLLDKADFREIESAMDSWTNAACVSAKTELDSNSVRLAISCLRCACRVS